MSLFVAIFIRRLSTVMPETDARTLSTQRKRRGVVKASITCLSSRLTELESMVEEPDTHDHAQRLSTKLETLDAEFKTHHFAAIDLIDDYGTLGREQETLDQHDDDVTSLAVRLQKLITASSATPTNSDHRKVLMHKLQHLEKSLTVVSENVSSLSSRPEDVCRLQQHEEQLSDYKKDLAEFRNSLLSSSIEEGDELLGLHSALEKRFSIVLSRLRSCYDQVRTLQSLHLHLLPPTARELSFQGWTHPLLTATSSTGNVSGSSSASQSTTVPPSRILRSWFTCSTL